MRPFKKVTKISYIPESYDLKTKIQPQNNEVFPIYHFNYLEVLKFSGKNRIKQKFPIV